jgi:alpha-N-arabinofuranosidase
VRRPRRATVVDAVAMADDDGISVFLVNRSATEKASVRVDLARAGVVRVDEAVTLWDADPGARNTLADPERVGLRSLDAHLTDGELVVELAPASWSAVRLAR